MVDSPIIWGLPAEGIAMGPGYNIQNINESSFVNSTVTNVNNSGADKAHAAELRSLLRAHRAELVRLGGAKGERVDSRIEEMEEELGKTELDKAAVGSAWRSALKVLAGGAAAAESVTKIGDAVRSFLGA